MTSNATAETPNPVRDPDTGEIDILEDAWEEMQGTPPEYTIIPVPKKSNVDPGGTIEIDLYVNGYGGVSQSKLQINYPYPDLITKEERKGELNYSIWLAEDSEPPAIYSTQTPQEEHRVGEWGATAIIEPELFSPFRDKDCAYPLLTSEVTFAECPFLQIKLFTSEDVDSGNYPIHYTFTYGDQDDVSQDHKETVVHINNARERREPWVTRGAIVIVLIALASLLIQAWNTLWV
ncbi:hypothetical protein [Haloplanus rubicundus]|uniref:hypothetical protein n=1 Tax=Haloplanus rubicundus TaxID=1547898 RepID=UPI00130070D8|nr:hypothetical protein [Haloplanus rubicundus]